MTAAPTSGGTPALEVEDVGKRFGAVEALDDVSFSLGPRELLALVGPSGCGKSTLLRVVAGLVRNDRGRVRLRGELVDADGAHVPPEHRGIGLVFQDHALFPHLRVAGNVAFGIRGATRAEVRRRVGEALELVDLAGHERRYPHELSGGERQRVALARALAPRPTLLLLDEPFASLDPNLRAQLRVEVEAALRTTDTPAVFVTHDQTEAMAVGDRVAVMRAGRIEQLDTPAAVYHRPADRFVAGFMGEASFLPVIDGAAGPRTVLGPVDAGSVAAVVAMVRPDDVTFAVEPDGDAEVVASEFRGSTWCHTIRLHDGTVVRSSAGHLDPVGVGSRGRVSLTPGHRQILLPAGG